MKKVIFGIIIAVLLVSMAVACGGPEQTKTAIYGSSAALPTGTGYIVTGRHGTITEEVRRVKAAMPWSTMLL